MAQLTYTIADAKLAEFKLGFLKVYPVPLDDAGVPIMSENAWIKARGKRFFLEAYKGGKEMILNEGDAGIIEDIVT